MRHAVVAGAGPAGLTAALELLRRGGWSVTVCEATENVGGVARTAVHHGNRMDLGGHRFFTKNERVSRCWESVMPEGEMLTRNRLSRIYYGGKFFSYPVTLSAATLRAMGLAQTLRAGMGYLASMIRKRPENSLEDFYINRFGRPLYGMFFESYTAKVWGKHPSELRADWGSQRVKGLSVAKVLAGAVKSLLGIRSRKVETSLIDAFSYPRLGPGQMWEGMAREIEASPDGRILFNAKVDGINVADGRVVSVTAGGKTIECDAFFSSMPLDKLVDALHGVALDAGLRRKALALPFRDFITVGVLLNRRCELPDNWIYLQDRHMVAGRLQVFNNWSPSLVAEPDGTTWVGLEYFCNEGDALWMRSDGELCRLAVDELVKLGFARAGEVADSCVLRVPRAYPGYFGTYDCLDALRGELDKIANLYCIGRNGQHRYNNMDHSMLTAMIAADLASDGSADKSELWNVNTEEDYHEEDSEK